MTETPREYKKRIEEKWKRNEKNKDKLIKKIEGYELLDERFKTETKQEILANFEKNQKAELEGEQYTTIVLELGKIDKKYEELDELKKQLKEKRLEKNKIENEIKGSKLDGADETTLKLQMEKVRKLNEKLEKLQSEMEEFDKEIGNREIEICEIEDSYGKIIENEKFSEEIKENSYKEETSYEQNLTQPETLKEVHEQVIKELWSKDKTRREIIKLLDNGTGIDEELKERIKEELFEKFFDYYDEKQGNLKVKSARYMKNKVKKGGNSILPLYEGNRIKNDLNEITKDVDYKTLNHVRRKWKRKVAYEDDENDEYQKKITNALDNIPVKIKVSNGSRIIEFKLGDKAYKFLVVDDLTKCSDSTYLKHGKLDEKGMIGHNLDNWKNKKLAEYINEQEKKGFTIPTGDYMEDIVKKLSKLIGNYTDNLNTQISHLMYLTGLEGDYRLDEFSKGNNGVLSRCWYGFRFDYNQRYCFYNSGKYEKAKLFMIYNK